MRVCLQAEALALKHAKAKVSKADKLTWMREQRALGKQLKAKKAALRDVGVQHGAAAENDGADDAMPAAAAADDAPSAPPVFEGFRLPTPSGGAAEAAQVALLPRV